MLFSEVSSQQLITGGVVAGGVYLLKTTFELYGQYSENKDRKVIRDNIVAQTEVLRNVATQQNKQDDDIRSINLSISTAMERQLNTLPKIDRIDRHVSELKAVAGIPDTTL